MEESDDNEMNVDGSAEARTTLIDLSSNTEKDQDENSGGCSSDIMQIHSHVLIKEEPGEKGL